jgi:glucoamylase
LPEQVWDSEDIPEAHMKKGQPTGSAMPLCWAHAEYLMLARSRKDGVNFECPTPVRERYAIGNAKGKFEIWTQSHQLPRVQRGKTLRIIAPSPCSIRWSADSWNSFIDAEAKDSGLSLWYVDLPTEQLPALAKVDFTIKWTRGWEGRDFHLTISS